MPRRWQPKLSATVADLTRSCTLDFAVTRPASCTGKVPWAPYRALLWHNGHGLFAGWRCQQVTLQDLGSGALWRFVVNTWINRAERAEGGTVAYAQARSQLRHPAAMWRAVVVNGDRISRTVSPP